MNVRAPRGIRNNNPGNIRAGDPWQGLMPSREMNADQLGETEFCVFVSPKWGIRALARFLIAYKDRHGLETVWDILHRWAPPSENDTLSYIAAVSRQLGVHHSDAVDVYDYAVMRALAEAIIRHENGTQPYDDLTIDEGLRLAGIEVPVKRPAESREIKGQQVAAAGVGLGVLTEIGAQLQPLVAIAAPLKWVFVAVTLAGIALTVYARMKANAEGVR